MISIIILDLSITSISAHLSDCFIQVIITRDQTDLNISLLKSRCPPPQHRVSVLPAVSGDCSFSRYSFSKKANLWLTMLPANNLNTILFLCFVNHFQCNDFSRIYTSFLNRLDNHISSYCNLGTVFFHSLITP